MNSIETLQKDKERHSPKNFLEELALDLVPVLGQYRVWREYKRGNFDGYYEPSPRSDLAFGIFMTTLGQLSLIDLSLSLIAGGYSFLIRNYIETSF